MAWDFPESTPLTGGLAFDQIAKGIATSIEQLPSHPNGFADVADCRQLKENHPPAIVSNRPTLLRQYWLCRLVGFLLRLAEANIGGFVSIYVYDHFFPKSRRAYRGNLSAGRERKQRNSFS